MMKRLGVALIIAVPLTVAAKQPPAGEPPKPVVFDAVRTEMIEQYTPVTGELQPVRRALLAAEEEGLVIEVVPEQGDAVRKGDVIARLRETKARLDVAKLEADLAFKNATVAEREADLLRARQDLERVEALASQSSAAWNELEDRKTAVAGGEARLEAARADAAATQVALNWANEQLARMTIVAPFDGRVVSKRTEIGQWLSKGDGVVELLALDQIDARLDVPERFIERITGSSEPVRVQVKATGEVVQAPIAAIVPEADTRSRLFPVRIRLDNPEGRLRPGMSIIGLVPSGTTGATRTADKDAVMRDDAGEFVFFDGGGRAAVARVRTLFPAPEGRVAIEAPTLPEGALLIVEGNERLFPGAPVAPLQAPGAAAAAPAPTNGNKQH